MFLQVQRTRHPSIQNRQPKITVSDSLQDLVLQVHNQKTHIWESQSYLACINSHRQQGTGQAAAGIVLASRPWVSVSQLFPNLSQEHFLTALSVLEKAAAGYRASSISVPPNVALRMGLHILVCVRTAWRNASSARNVNLLMSGYMTRRSQHGGETGTPHSPRDQKCQATRQTFFYLFSSGNNC